MLPVWIATQDKRTPRFVIALVVVCALASCVWQAHDASVEEQFRDRWGAIPCEVTGNRTLTADELTYDDCAKAPVQPANPVPAYADKNPTSAIFVSLVLGANLVHAVLAVAMIGVFGWPGERQFGGYVVAAVVATMAPTAVVVNVLAEPNSTRPLSGIDFVALVLIGLAVGAKPRGTAFVVGPGVVPVRLVTAGLVGFSALAIASSSTTINGLATRLGLVVAAAVVGHVLMTLQRDPDSEEPARHEPTPLIVRHTLAVRDVPTATTRKVDLPAPNWFVDPWRPGFGWRWYDGRRWSYAHSIDGRRPRQPPGDAVGALPTNAEYAQSSHTTSWT